MIIIYFLLNISTTIGGTNSSILTPCFWNSFIYDEDIKPLPVEAIKNIVSISLSKYSLPAANWNSYSKSVTARKPRTIASHFNSFALVTINDEVDITSIFSKFLQASYTINTLSSAVK